MALFLLASQLTLASLVQEHDQGKMYAGLRRVCNEADGCAIWVSEESLGKIEKGKGRMEGGQRRRGRRSKRRRLLNAGNVELLVEMGNEIMGKIEVEGDMTLAGVRELINDELNVAPEFFKFVDGDGMKVNKKQEKKKFAINFMPKVTIVETDKL